MLVFQKEVRGKRGPEFSDGGCEAAAVTRGSCKWRSSGPALRSISLIGRPQMGDGVKNALDGLGLSQSGLDGTGGMVAALLLGRC